MTMATGLWSNWRISVFGSVDQKLTILDHITLGGIGRLNISATSTRLMGCCVMVLINLLVPLRHKREEKYKGE